MIEVQVAELKMDRETNSPVVILKEADGDRVLPIWIGPAEANSIAIGLYGHKFPRPLTHDLVSTIIKSLRASVVKVLISDLKENTFYATILIQGGQEVVAIDARPSDSIAIALRAGSPIFVDEKLLAHHGDRIDASQLHKPSPEERAEELRRYLEQLSPEDFGKFQL